MCELAQVNSMRVFISPQIDLREMFGSSFGKSLSGVVVSNQARYLAAVAQLRTPGGHDPSASWAHPLKYSNYERWAAGPITPRGSDTLCCVLSPKHTPPPPPPPFPPGLNPPHIRPRSCPGVCTYATALWNLE